MRCEEFEAALLEGREIDAAMREHAANCEACQVLLHQADVLCDARALDDTLVMPESFTRGWRQAIREKPVKSRAFPLVRVAAVACCAFVLVGVGLKAHKSKPAADSADAGARVKVSGMAASYAPDARMAVTEEEAEWGGTIASSGEEDSRRIVRSAQLELSTDAFDETLGEIKARALQSGGEISYSEVNTAYDDLRRAYIELTVPEASLDDFLSGAGTLGEVTRQVVSSQDMTTTYQDNASRLESARAQKQRLDELYAQAQSMTDIVAITDALFEVQREIDELTGANQRIDSRAANAHVSVTLTETAADQKPFLKQLGENVLQGVRSIGAFFSSAALFIAWALPWVALLGCIALVTVLIVRHRRNKN